MKFINLNVKCLETNESHSFEIGEYVLFEKKFKWQLYQKIMQLYGYHSFIMHAYNFDDLDLKQLFTKSLIIKTTVGDKYHKSGYLNFEIKINL